jgi:hypothetical protein
MKMLSASAAVFIFILTAFTPPSQEKKVATTAATTFTKTSKDPKIQVAILLDVSGSMSGLIEQAKAQLWNMVSVMGRAKCENGIPKIEIALYEYGRPADDVKTGYIKQISGFTSDLDNLSQELFKLRTDGGDEYCGHVIHTSLDELNWDSASSNYKVIFIAGNEDFLQGSIHYTQSCGEAKKKGVIVNTIYCGPKEMGIREHWNLNGECGNGSFTNIDQNAKEEDIPTPYDSTLVALNNKLNGTYLTYGWSGVTSQAKQTRVDNLNMSLGKREMAKRSAVKAKSQLYNNATWDMVDAYKADTVNFINKVDLRTLPDSLKNKSREELEAVVEQKNAERGAIQTEMLKINSQREAYINSERSKTAVNNNNKTTLETEVEKIIKEQVKRFNMVIE